jgi:transposase-like protein
MSKKRVGSKEFSPEEKVEILKDISVIGNVSKVAQKWGVSRQTIYNWKAERSKIDDEIILRENKPDLDHSSILELEKYRNVLSDLGTLEQRKEKMSAKVEFMLMKITTLLENHPDLDAIHPKDLSKIMKDLHDVRKELSNEPTIIIEYKNKMREQTLQVLQDFLNLDQLREFAQRMEAIEADYEVV